jgi:TPR repeat protein
MMPGGLELERRVKEREEQMKEGKGDRMGKKGRKKLGYEEQPLVFEKVEQNGKKVEENAVSERGNGEGRLPFRDKMSEAVPKQMGKPSLDKEDEVFDERKADTQKDGEALSQNREVKFLSQMNLGIRRELKRARRGDGDSQEKLGSYYAEEGTKHLDYEEAIYWYQLAAKKGNFKAQMGLGQIFDSGKVQDADSKAKGIFWFQKLASEGFPTAQCILGLKYLWGDGVEEDRKEAMKWLQRAADQGYEQARLYLDDEEK